MAEISFRHSKRYRAVGLLYLGTFTSTTERFTILLIKYGIYGILPSIQKWSMIRGKLLRDKILMTALQMKVLCDFEVIKAPPL